MSVIFRDNIGRIVNKYGVPINQMKNKFKRCKNVKTGKYELAGILIFLLLVGIETVFIKTSAFSYYHIPLCLMFAYVGGRFSACLYNREAWGQK